MKKTGHNNTIRRLMHLTKSAVVHECHQSSRFQILITHFLSIYDVWSDSTHFKYRMEYTLSKGRFFKNFLLRSREFRNKNTY
jgi:hypothetical protein